MADSMSFDKYIDNPSGGASVVTNRKMYKDMYKAKFDAVLVREQGTIKYYVYHDTDNTDSYYIHMKIPSEVIDNFYDDVVIRLFTTVGSKKSSTELRAYSVQFYSNDPAFVYTFAYSFSKNKLFIKDLESKMSKTALNTKAKVKNPHNDVWYVKSLFFAYLTMERYNLFNRTTLDRAAKKYSKKVLSAKIDNADKKIYDRQVAAEKKSAAEKEAKQKIDKERNTGISAPITRKASASKITATSKITKKVSPTKTSKITTMHKPKK